MTRQQTLRWVALVGGLLVVIALLLVTSGAIDRWSMRTHAEQEMAALKPGQVVPPSAQDGREAPAGAVQPEGPARRAGFRPPAHDQMPDGEFGQRVRRGYEIFTDTPQAASQFVGNTMRCSSCHLDAGRLADSAPLWAAFVSYPAFRGKTQEVNTFAQRIQGCFKYSMNGTPPPADHEVLVALESYSYWLARGAPVDPEIEGRGYPALAEPEKKPDFERGRKLFAQNCALCHGPDGAGQRTADGHTVFPALWGPDSFNWGAGMGRINNAAAFIRANMPLGLGGTLSEQAAWDLALYMNSHERPQDPRYLGSVAETRQRFHDTEHSMYGRMVNGKLLGDIGPPKTARPAASASPSAVTQARRP